ncbi:roadblock/LC7 domain-containing protein [Entomomonas sp. E2T0]|uniref:roadblock/LC7 domain-containing protein n=1 Tax=Entomomonas sp. E2T0 TaxID=2930213 RepID=UPI0022282550|nr:roadblock/LC7 domain-containing protein [Entomomonas sp. E2T0]UYZ82877.1 roadblock/LC7 domain-containing protein [Entomomonas sp. E2T0]
MSKEKVAEIPKVLKVSADKLLKELVEADNGIETALVTTEDGFSVAIHSTEQVESSKLAAMASSLSAIGNLSVEETNTGTKYHSMIIESDNGYVLIMDICHEAFPMILNIVASKKAILGRVIHSAKSVVDILQGNASIIDRII